MIEIQDTTELKKEIGEFVSKFGSDHDALMPILSELQSKYNGISNDAMQVLADLLHMHPIEIQGVVTFFKFYNTDNKGKFIIRMCETMPCKMKQAKNVADELEQKLGIKFGETTSDKMFSLEWTSCIGMCDQGPAFLINDKPYTRVKPEQVSGILSECRGGK